MPLRVYNTLTKQKENFETVQPGRVTMYVCGPTVYKPSHIGHMVGPVIFDTVKRYLTYLGYQVHWIVNITDVDDKLIVRSRELKTTVKYLAEKMTADYVACLTKLGVTSIDSMPKATEHIQEMLNMIQGLIDQGFAYPAAGDVYFDISKDEDYGKLCHRDPEQMEAGARIEVSDRKRNPGDFALWKGAKPGEPQWESPWGPGRPGWHIECSAMSMKHLGATIDIHGGGLDLQFPHHENELAQSESYSGKTFARYWMHNGLLRIKTKDSDKAVKMAGSVGNVINIEDLLKNHHPETVRFLLLNTHYRSPIEYSEDRLQEVRRSLEGFYRFFERYQRITGACFYQLQADVTDKHKPTDGGEFGAEITQLRTQFLEAMSDDFNTGGAVGTLFEMLTALNRFADAKKLEDPKRDAAALVDWSKGVSVFRELSQILGLFPAPVQATTSNDDLAQPLQALLTETGGAASDTSVAGLMTALIEQRHQARKNKNFALGDQIRKRLSELGVTLEDRPGGKTEWRRA